MRELNSAEKWLLFQIGKSLRNSQELSNSEQTSWEANTNSKWHYEDRDAINIALSTLLSEGLVSERNMHLALSEVGGEYWEQLFCPCWERAYQHLVLEDGFEEITSSSIQTCIFVFCDATFLQLVKLDSLQMAKNTGYYPFYWKFIGPAWSLRFQNEEIPVSLQSSIAFMRAKVLQQLFTSAEFAELQSKYNVLQTKIDNHRQMAISQLSWHHQV